MLAEFITDPEVQNTILDGVVVSIRISAIASVFALLIGFFVAFARNSHRKIFRLPASVYTELFRNTPLLIQLYFYYRGLQTVGVSLAPETCGILALSLYTGAYLTEIFRSGLLAIPKEQTDAGIALGFSRFKVYWYILIPQTVRIVLPAIGNQLISLLKNSSLVAFITVSDLFMVMYKGAVDNAMPFEYFTEGALIYIALSLAISGLVFVLERLLSAAHTREEIAHA